MKFIFVVFSSLFLVGCVVPPATGSAILDSLGSLVSGLNSGTTGFVSPSPLLSPFLVLPVPSPSVAAVGVGSVIEGENINGSVVVYFVDVGQGDAEVIVDGERVVVVDCGDAQHSVAGFLHGLNVSRVDLLVASHHHADHIGGCKQVFEEFTVSQVFDNGRPCDSKTCEDFIALAGNRLKVVGIGVENATWFFSSWTGLAMHAGGRDENADSVVFRLESGRLSVLFSGDCDAACEAGLLAAFSDYLNATVLKVGHHGSASSSSSAFLAVVSPEVAVIEVGAGNSYGHPTGEALARLAAVGARIYRTDLAGTVMVSLGSGSVGVATKK